MSVEITKPSQIIHGTFVQSGRGLKSVRLTPPESKSETGFATTTYSYCMSDEMQDYSAERIVLAMKLLSGKSNEDIIRLIAQQRAEENRNSQ